MALGSWGVGCETSGETAGGAVCTYAETIACETDSGCHSTQECLPDLTGYGPCVCGIDAGPTADSGLLDATRKDGQ